MNKLFLKNSLLALVICLLGACATIGMEQISSNPTDSSPTSLRARARLLTQLGNVASTIQINTQNGVVRLGGFVKDPIIKRRAEVIVRNMPEVRVVRNDIKVDE